MKLTLVTKSKERGEKGNCLAAALASMLDLEISDIPKFEEMCNATWKVALHEWAASIGVRVEFTREIPSGYCIGVGRAESGLLHAVILKDGFFHFDTAKSGGFYQEHRYCLLVERIVA